MYSHSSEKVFLTRYAILRWIFY